MGLYDSVDRGKPKPKRWTGPIALCCALFLLFRRPDVLGLSLPVPFSCLYLRFDGQHARCAKHRDVRVTVNGSETDVSIDDLSDLLYLIDKAARAAPPLRRRRCPTPDRLRRRLDA